MIKGVLSDVIYIKMFLDLKKVNVNIEKKVVTKITFINECS